VPSFRSLSIILREYDFSEADRILVFFTHSFGKIRAIAKGVRRMRSRLAGCVGLLSLSELQFHGKANQNLYLVTQGQLITAFPRIKADLQILGQAARIGELVDQLVSDQEPLPEIFQLLQESLELLESGVSPVVAGIWFEICFLDKMGYRPILQNCMICTQDKEIMAYVPERGGMVCRTCQSGSALFVSRGSRNLLEKLRTAKPRQVSRIRLNSQMQEEIVCLLNAAFYYQLGRGLRSDVFRRAIKRIDKM